jgi:uncharacterized protein (TIGR02217 family)
MAITIDDSVRLPVDIEREAEGGPRFNTDVNVSASGVTTTNQRWSAPLWQWDISYGVQELENGINDVRDVFIGARGRAYGFRFKDWQDYTIPLQVIGTGDGVETEFQIYKAYPHAVRPYSRKITRPVNGTIAIQVAAVPQVEGVDYTIDYSTGIITFTSPVPNLDAVFVEGEFDVPVMFADDQLIMLLYTQSAGEIGEIIIQEVRE